MSQRNPLSYHGHVITDKGDMLSLTDMWKAAKSKHIEDGGDPSDYESRRPSDWLALESTKQFKEAVEATLVAGNPGIQIKRGGRGTGGETLAHWQIGLAYAKYLDPNFHMWCNTAAREKMEGKAQFHGLSEADKNAIGGIVKSCAGVVLREQLLDLLPSMIETTVQARIADRSLLIRRGETALMIWDRFKLPVEIRGRSQWLGHRLIKFGCALAYGERADIAGNAVRLFDPDKANFAMNNGLLTTARAWAAERQGQGKLNLKG